MIISHHDKSRKRKKKNLTKKLSILNAYINFKLSKVSNSRVIQDGYLDIGLIDTMKDLIVNFIGAVVFSIFGWLYIKNRDEHKFAERFIPVVRNDK